MKVEVGQIYKVLAGGLITTNEGNDLKRRVIIEAGELIEIRYPYEWHFRTQDNQYYHVEKGNMLKNCKLFGKVIEQVRFNGKANLDEIIRLKLYVPA